MQLLAGDPIAPDMYRYEAAAVCGYCGLVFHVGAIWSTSTLNFDYGDQTAPRGAWIRFFHALGYTVAMNMHICAPAVEDDPWHWADWSR